MASFYIRTNDTGKNFRVVTARVAAPDRDHWTELVALDPDHPLEDFDLFQTFAVATRRKLGLPTARSPPLRPWERGCLASRFSDLGSNPRTPRRHHLPRAHLLRRPARQPHLHRGRLPLQLPSLVSPPSVYEYNVARDSAASGIAIGQSKLLKQQEVPGGFDSALYASERIWVDAPVGDQAPGTSSYPGSSDRVESTIPVPVSIVYRRDCFHRDATNPLYVYGYGSYGYPLPVGFSPTRLSLLDRGVVMAYAHIRGGGELGDTWHDAGKMQLKRNTFTDFIAVTEALTAQRSADPPASPSKAAAPAACSWAPSPTCAPTSSASSSPTSPSSTS